MKLFKPSLVALASLVTGIVALHAEEDYRIKIEESSVNQAPAYEIAEQPKVEGIEAIYYEGPEFKGKPSKVFAYYGRPAVKPGEKVPGIVLVHGGGGTAFPEWVKLWVSRGYAAIAMDTVGHVPINEPTRIPVPGGGITCGPDFVHLDEPLTDQWPYYAVNSIARARTLLGSFPEVDETRIGISGISWGGFLSTIAASLDKRYAYAVHVYGCGFLKESSAWSEELSEPGKDRWVKWFDPALYLPENTTPILWLTGTNDNAYSFESFVKSYELVREAPVTLCIKPGMPHGHPEGWSPLEIAAYADSFTKKGVPLPKVTEEGGSPGGRVWARYRSKTKLKSATLVYALKSEANWKERVWETLPATIRGGGGEVSASIPKNTQYYYFNITDERDLTVSSDVKGAFNDQ